ncbi:hypothetical protein ACWEVD_10070 [Nocardia thailandica]
MALLLAILFLTLLSATVFLGSGRTGATGVHDRDADRLRTELAARR